MPMDVISGTSVGAINAAYLAATCDDPREVLHRRNSHDLVGLDCPLSDCVAFNGMSLSKQGWHPLVRAASEYVESGNREYEGSCLEQYYATWQPHETVAKHCFVRWDPRFSSATLHM